MVEDLGKTLGGSLGELGSSSTGQMVQERFGGEAGRMAGGAFSLINQLIFGGERLDILLQACQLLINSRRGNFGLPIILTWINLFRPTFDD